MKLNHISDTQLLSKTKLLVQSEREGLIRILHHLREIGRRKLFCDLGYGSLFEYAVKELRYSEGQAGRRIQAIRLLNDIPTVEKDIVSGELSLSNVAQAQSYFRNVEKQRPKSPLAKAEKIAVLKSLKNKSTREGQREIFKLQPAAPHPRSFEKERAVTETATEVRFLMTDNLKSKLEEVRALLGPKAVGMGYAELFAEMADLSAQKLAEKKFGKRRTGASIPSSLSVPASASLSCSSSSSNIAPAPEFAGVSCAGTGQIMSVPSNSSTTSPSKPSSSSKNARYIPKAIQQAIWHRDKRRCTNCGGQRNLNIDHIQPVACGGESVVENLRLLCFSCNQRAAMKVFGVGRIAQRTALPA